MKELLAKLTWVDCLVFLAVLRGCYGGYRSGFFPELLRIVGYLLTAMVTLRYQEALAQYLTLKTFLNLTTATAVAFAALLIGVFLITKLFVMILLKLFKVGEGAFFYRLLGMVMGACRWLVLLSLLFMLIERMPFLAALKTDIQERSFVGPSLSRVAPVLFDFLSKISPQLGVTSVK